MKYYPNKYRKVVTETIKKLDTTNESDDSLIKKLTQLLSLPYLLSVYFVKEYRNKPFDISNYKNITDFYGIEGIEEHE